MKGSPVRVRASASPICKDFFSEQAARFARLAREGSTWGPRLAATRPFRIASLIVIRRRRGASRMTLGVRAGGEAGVGVAEVLGHFVERPPFVEKQGRAGVAKVVTPEVGDAGTLERRDPDAAAPVVATEVTALAVREHELLRVRASACEVELDGFARDRLVQGPVAAPP